MKKVRVILPAIAFAFAAVSGVFASNVLVKAAWINRGTAQNPQVQQVTVADNCVISSSIPCTVTVSGTAYQTYTSSSAAATLDASQRFLHP